jgi:hypothetical protein
LTTTGFTETKPAVTAGPPRRTPAWKRQIAMVARWLHIYLSMASFAIVLFFAVTGLTLNHAEMFNDQARTTVIKGQVERKWLTGDVDKLDIVEHLRNTNGVKSALSEFRVEDTQCSVSFKGPGYTADAFIERSSGTYELTVVRSGIVAVLNDLHKGRDTGGIWSGIIDVSAGLMTLVSLTGLVLIFFLQKRRMPGLIAVAIGAVLCLLVYYVWVP